MTAVALLLAAVALGLAVWSYALYPPLIERLAARADAVPDLPVGPASVEVIVSAADEEAVIADRVRDLRAQQFPGPYAIAIGCDGSTDRTAAEALAAARESADGSAVPVRVVAFPTRRGKASVLNDLIASSRSEVLVFTDANTRFELGAVAALTHPLGDPSVGAVCGRLVFESAPAEGTPESLFWDRETLLKEAEGQLGVCLGANGAIYAARRSAVEPLPADTTSMDDFLIPARIARRGLRVVFAGDAVAREKSARDVRAEMPRRFRIGIGAGQVLRRETWLFAVWRRPALSFAFLSRKAARWLAPVLALAAAAAGLFVPWLRGLCAAALVFAALCLAAARGRPQLEGLPGKLYYFVVMNLALSAGVIAGLFGYSRPAWKPTAR
jgi:cellulose synthase/poly-beta-1,6-N-acetylglucosamine synthase-like glycosyltransferase